MQNSLPQEYRSCKRLEELPSISQVENISLWLDSQVRRRVSIEVSECSLTRTRIPMITSATVSNLTTSTTLALMSPLSSQAIFNFLH